MKEGIVHKFFPALYNFKFKRKKVLFSSLFPHLTIFQRTSNTRGLGAARSWGCVVFVLNMGNLLGGLKVSTSAVLIIGSLKDQDFRLTEGRVDGEAGAESDGRKD